MRNQGIAVLSLVLALGLVSCGQSTATGSGSSAGSQGSDQPQGKVSVSFWTSLGHDKLDLLNQKLIPLFNQETNNRYEIKVDGGTDYDSLYAKLKTALAAGTQPTMAFAYPDHAAFYASQGALQPLDEYVDDPQLGFTPEDGQHKDASGKEVYGADDFVANYWNEGKGVYKADGTQDPNLYVVPFYKSSEVLLYNADYLHAMDIAVPHTWDELIQACKDIQAKDSRFTTGDNWPLFYDSDANLFISNAKQMGYGYTDPTKLNGGNPFAFVNEKAKAFTKSLNQLHSQHLLITKKSAPNQSYSSNYFTDEKAIFAVGSTGGTSFNFSDSFSVGAAAVPAFNPAQPAYIQQGPSVCIFSRASEEAKKGAWLFYKFISRWDNSVKLALSTGYDPVRISSLESDEYQSNITQKVKDYVDHPETNVNKDSTESLIPMVSYITSKYAEGNLTFTSPAFIGSAETRAAVDDMVGSIVGYNAKDDADLNAFIDKAFNTAVAEAGKGLVA